MWSIVDCSRGDLLTKGDSKVMTMTKEEKQKIKVTENRRKFRKNWTQHKRLERSIKTELNCT